jgi:hypothetical protein
MRTKGATSMAAISVSLACWLIHAFGAPAQAQTASVAFSVSPNTFRAGGSASAQLSVTRTTVSPASLSSGDSFTFVFDSSVGTVSSILGPVSVNSASLAPGDFSASFTPTQVVISYNGQAKAFSFGDTLGVEVSFSAGSHVGTGKVSFLSRFTGSVNGSLPYTAVSIVDFANSGLASIVHDGTLAGNGTSATPLAVVAGSVAVATDATTLIGNGTTGMPLGVKAGSLPISTDATTLTGNGTTALPLGVKAGSLPIATDATTLTGNGTTGMPLGVKAGSLPIAHDGTMTGNGTTGTPLSVKGGSVAVATDGTTLAGNGTTATPLAVKAGSLPIATDAATLTGNGTTATPLAVKAGSLPVATDGTTLTGNGTSATPLGVAAGGVAIAHDGTMTGNGTTGSPLGIALPLDLEIPGDFITGVKIHSLGNGGAGMDVTGGAGTFPQVGGAAVTATGGAADGGNSGGDAIDAIAGHGGFGDGFAGLFEGAVAIHGPLVIEGNVTKSSGSFKIDHPLDPANKYLYHSFVESPDMMNIYNGNARLDSNGEAVVELPAWFGALNKDFRYLLTPIGAPAPGLYIAEQVAENHFKIAGGASGMMVSWQVTGIRQDAWANAHRIPVEELKADPERGHYIHPELFDQPEEKNMVWARRPQLMQRVKERREQQTKQARAGSSAAAAIPGSSDSNAPAKATAGNH